VIPTCEIASRLTASRAGIRSAPNHLASLSVVAGLSRPPRLSFALCLKRSGRRDKPGDDAGYVTQSNHRRLENRRRVQ